MEVLQLNHNHSLSVHYDEDVVRHFPPALTTHHHIFLLLSVYLTIVKIVGPRYMNERKPFQLKGLIMIYNLSQILMNIYIMYLYSNMMGNSSLNWWGDVCQPVSAANNYDPAIKDKMSAAMVVYYVNKLLDLFDTIFFILRKKESQITFLHLFHHSTMVLSTWVSIIYLREEISVIFAGMNAVVHVVMYSYYFLSSFGPHIQKYLWWKKHITKIQIAQFIVALSSLAKMKMDNCQNNPWFWAIWTFNVSVFLGLFLNFYIHAYTKKSKAQ